MSLRTFGFALVVAAVAAFCIGFAAAPVPSKTPGIGASPRSDSRDELDSAAIAQPSSAASVPEDKPAAERSGSVEAVFDALGERTGGAIGFRVREAISRLNVTQLDELLGQIETVGRNDQFQILPRAIDRLMELDPARAVGWMRESAATFREGSTTFRRAFEMIARRDFNAARKLFGELPPGDRRNQFGQELLAQLAERSPGEAKAWLESFPNGSARDLAAQGYVTGLAKSDPLAAIEIASKWTDGAAQDTALATALSLLVKSSPARALDALTNVKDGVARGRAFSQMVLAAKDEDLPDMVAYFQRTVAELPHFGDFVSTTARMAEGMARKDPAAGLAWARTLSGKQRELAIKWSLITWSAKDPEAALSASLGGGGVESNARPLDLEIFNRCLNQNFTVTRAWVEKLPPGPVRDTATQRIGWGLAARGDEESARQLLRQVPEAGREQLGRDIASSLASENPGMATRWLGQSAADADSARIFGRIASQWAKTDLKAAGTWADKLPAGPARDAAVGRFATEVVGLDPATAAEWAASVSDENQRTSVIGGIILAWHERDPDAARRWLEATPALKPDRRQLLRSLFQ